MIGLALLSRIKPQHIMIVLLIVLGGFAVWAWGEIKFQKQEKIRQRDNYENLRDLDSLKTAVLQFRTNDEMEDYIATNKDLKALLDKQDIKLKRATNIIYQKQQYINNIENKLDVSGLVENVRKDLPAKMSWKDSTDCLVIQGNVAYQNDSLAVNVTNRKFENDIAIVGGWERNQKNFFTKIFGRKKAKVTATTKCGESKTIVLEKQKQ